ncbi:hypothetical protein NGRA_3634, partial [Nosema granulosis]
MGHINRKQRTVLIDTGADVSLIGLEDVAEEERKLEPYTGVVRSASGETLKIRGKKDRIKIMIGTREIFFSPLVMDKCRCIILGADVIRNYPEILTKIMEKIDKRERRIYGLSEANLKEEFSDIFKTEIGDFNMCTIGKHNIDTTL